MICLDFLYYTQKQLPKKIQIVPFEFQLLECYDIDESKLPTTSLFKYIWDPENFNNGVPLFYLKSLTLSQCKEISNCIYDRLLPSNHQIYITCLDTEGENLLDIQDINVLLDTYSNLQNIDNISSIQFSTEWFYHVVSYWKFLLFREITIDNHINLPRNSFFSKVISYISVYKQIYFISENKYIQELP